MISLLQKVRELWRRFPTWLRWLGYVCAVLLVIGLVAFGFVWQHYASLAATYDMKALSRGKNETIIVHAKGELIGSASEI